MPRNRRRRAKTSSAPEEPCSTAPANLQLQAPKNSTCTALESNGSACRSSVGRSNRKLCTEHHEEYKDLYREYKDVQARFDSITSVDQRPWYRGENRTEFKNRKQRLAQKVVTGDRAMRLRSHVNRRFFSMQSAEENRTHIQEILKLEFQLSLLRTSLDSLESREQAIKKAKERAELEEQAENTIRLVEEQWIRKIEHNLEIYRGCARWGMDLQRSNEELVEKLKSAERMKWFVLTLNLILIFMQFYNIPLSSLDHWVYQHFKFLLSCKEW